MPTSAPPNTDIRLSAPTQHTPAPFGRRLMALIIDAVIFKAVFSPLSWAIFFFCGGTSMLDGGIYSSEVVLFRNISYMTQVIVAFFYFGWFYSNKGATPGKMIMKLRVSHSAMETNLSYGRAFLRESIGKLLSAIIFGIGFLMAAFRDDKRSLHDLLFSTQVTYEP